MSGNDNLQHENWQPLAKKAKLHYATHLSDSSRRINIKKRERQQRYREQNREKLKQREAERRRRKQRAHVIAEPSISSNINRIELNNYEIIDVNFQSLPGSEGIQTSILAEEMNALQKERDRQQKYVEQNREKPKQLEAERRQIQQNSTIMAKSSSSSNVYLETTNEAIMDDEININTPSVSDLEETQNLFTEITERNERGRSNGNEELILINSSKCVYPKFTQNYFNDWLEKDLKIPPLRGYINNTITEQIYLNDKPIKLEKTYDSENAYSSHNTSNADEVNSGSIHDFDAYDKFALSIAEKIRTIPDIAGRIRLMNAVQNVVENFCAQNAQEISIARDDILTTNCPVQATLYVPVLGGLPISPQGISPPRTVLAAQAFQQPLFQPRTSQSVAAGQKFPAKRRKITTVPIEVPMGNNHHMEVLVETTIPTEFVETKIVKTRAQRQKEYRMRKKNEKQLHSAKKNPKTNAERQHQFRQHQKMSSQNEAFDVARKKNNAVRSKRYRDKLKSKKRHPDLSNSLSAEEDSLSTSLNTTPAAAAEDDVGEARPQIDILEIKEERIQDDEPPLTSTTATTEIQPVNEMVSGVAFIHDPIPIKLEIVEDTVQL